MSRLRITYNAPVILTFALAATGVQLLPTSLQSWFVAYPHIGDGYGLRSYVGLFTHILGHASWQHLMGNFMLILLIGPILEERHGSARLLAMILVTALVTGLANALLATHIVLGASGVAFMMILLASTANIRAGEIPLTFLAVAALYLGGELYRSVVATDNISHFTHLIGGAAGAAFGFIGARSRRSTSR